MVGRPKTGVKPVKNITVDADIQDHLSKLCDELDKQFGFRPTISQAIRHLLIKRMEK